MELYNPGDNYIEPFAFNTGTINVTYVCSELAVCAGVYRDVFFVSNNRLCSNNVLTIK